MTLIKCSECGKQISDKAKTCVHCGNPIFKQKIEKKEKKTWDELTQDEINKIVSYRKLKKEWWNVPSRFVAMFLLIIGMIFILFGFILGISAAAIIPGVIIIIAGSVLSAYSMKETKTWYENNKNRLYEEEVLK